MSAILFNLEQEVSSESNAQLIAEASAAAYTNAEELESLNCDNICSVLLGNKMSALDLNEVAISTDLNNGGGGSDSGVETATTTSATLQRALSSNSGGYTSSNGCLDETTTTNTTTTQNGLNMSCESSMISCGSELYDLKNEEILPAEGGHPTNSVTAPARSTNSYDCCSENGSESSSVTGPGAISARRSNSVRKKVAMFEPGAQVSGSPAVKSMRERSESTPNTGGQMHGTPQNRPRLGGIKRTSSLSRPNQASPPAQVRLHASRMHENQTPTSCRTPTAANTTPFRATQNRHTKPQKPDSLPNALNRTQSISMQRLVQRTPSLSRARTPGTPSDDGRWPSMGSTRSTASSTTSKRGLSATPDLSSLKMRSSMLASVDAKSLHSNPYSTLPRHRKQKSVEDLSGRGSRSSSTACESRMASSVVISSRKSLVNSYGGAGTASAAFQASPKMLPPPANNTNTVAGRNLTGRKLQTAAKTRIYHETSVQTVLTSGDLEKVFAGGVAESRPIDAVEQCDQQTQSDIRDRELERLRDEVRQLTQREHELSAKLQREREEKLTMQRELHLNTERVMGMLEMARVAGGVRGFTDNASSDVGTPVSDDGGHDSLLMLESQIQMSGHELFERQQEIGQLRQLCRSLQLEMQRSLTAQECLLQEKAAIEQESSELQDFLQHEKVAMCEALKESESEYQVCQQQLTRREEEVKVLRDECRHLVRLNEQRRQENRMLQTKYSALETKSKELIMQQNYSVSGASAALSGLHTRLDSLVEQLVSTYNITENDLEDIGFQEEATSNEHENQITKASANGLDIPLHPQSHQLLLQPNDGSLSPQRNQSFIAAVISAIRNATTPSGKKITTRNGKRSNSHQAATSNVGSNSCHQNGQVNNDEDSDSTEMLDSETEPCLMMDNVLEDVTLPDSHSHNLVSSCTGMPSQIDVPSELINPTTGDESLHNLSQAIANRQQMELQINALSVKKMAVSQFNQQETSNSEDISCHDSLAEMPSLIEYCTAQAVVDQVIEVDNLITKLLKVLRLIQMDNDNCIQQLIVDKNKLQQNKEDMLEKLKDLEDVNMKLQDELMDATQELMLKNGDLSNTKTEMQRHRNEIDRLTQDICNLSTLCSNYKKLSPTVEFVPMPQSLAPIATAEEDSEGEDNDALSIINLLKMWQSEGQLKHYKVRSFLNELHAKDKLPLNTPQACERLRIYANQLENVLRVLQDCGNIMNECPDLLQLRNDIEVVKLNANWTHIVDDKLLNNSAGYNSYSCDLVLEDMNANEENSKERD